MNQARGRKSKLRLSATAQAGGQTNRANLRTCKQCKQQYDPESNHPRACKYHTAHYGGETRRKFESVYEGGTLTTADGGKITAYWHCCGNQDPTDPGCEAAPHRSYDE
ncbi:hypothetical protein KFL_005310090 [Klebsormidium nitens]|uniref:Uncharacterized protein n=1 Tax=Klebsormidium nitens TaxID=105231 RepID=A0A1Y1IN21_KLENI|nr:hypothetical protein KFL_005310090 [Klebsormidium nitens]|eukprot:GAQ89518.1 hypothetical protein KFL_005310090 [Klebsormidium nitens]